MFLALLRRPSLQKLVVDILPVAQPALHDPLNERQILGRRPVLDEKWVVQMIVDKEVVLGCVEQLGLASLALSVALETQSHVLVWLAVQATDLDTLLDVALADRAGHRSG